MDILIKYYFCMEEEHKKERMDMSDSYQASIDKSTFSNHEGEVRLRDIK